MTFVFDLGGVLVDIDVHGLIERFTALMPEGGNAGFNPNELLAGGGDSFLHDYEMGYISTEQAMTHFRALCRPDVSDDTIREVWNSELASVPKKTKELLRQLKQQGHTLFLLSNTNAMHWETYILPMFCEDGYRLSDYFDRAFLSYELHLFKPQPEMYDQIARYIPAGDKVVYIDDVERNRLAAPQTWETFASIEEMRKAIQ